jgi:hypothetical protein
MPGEDVCGLGGEPVDPLQAEWPQQPAVLDVLELPFAPPRGEGEVFQVLTGQRPVEPERAAGRPEHHLVDAAALQRTPVVQPGVVLVGQLRAGPVVVDDLPYLHGADRVQPACQARTAKIRSPGPMPARRKLGRD